MELNPPWGASHIFVRVDEVDPAPGLTPLTEPDLSFGLRVECYTEYSTQYVERRVEVLSVRHALLALLAEGPAFGLRLQQEFESRTGEVWPLNVGQVYTTLQRLERDGFVVSGQPDGGGVQKDYEITSLGRGELEHWLRTPPEADTPPRDELVIKVLVAVRVPGVDVRSVIQAHRRHLVEEMQKYTRVKTQAAPDDHGLALVVDAELFRLEGVVRWLDAADARLMMTSGLDEHSRLKRESPGKVEVPR
jgi:DNA-binding PadR family transcriptional regulator